jgi:amidohydrolase
VGPTVMLRTEMDALPVEENTGLPFASTVKGAMHACGHDIHMSAWVGTAKLMAANRARWSGTLMMVGQLAEEGSGGARAMLADGLFTRFPKPDFALSLHDDDTMPSGRIGWHSGAFRAGSDRVRITIHGRGGHAAMPHKTVDPVVIAGHVIVKLQTIVSRETNPVEPVVVTIGSIHGGTQANIIPGEVTMELSVRTYTPENRTRVLEAIGRIVRAEAIAAGAPQPPEIETRQNAPPVYNDPELTARLASALRKTLGEGNVVEMPAKMTSEDFAEYGREGVPSALLHIGAVNAAKLEAAKSGEPVPAPHSAEWAPEREPTLKGAIRAEIGELIELLGKR